MMSTSTRAFSHRDVGSDERRWRRFLSEVDTVHFADFGAVERVVVVAPHPDDESLGAGGVAASWSAAGADVSVVACTDGEAAECSATPAGILARRRRRELDAAAEELGTGRPVTVRRLGLEDGGLERNRSQLVDALDRCVAGADLVIGPWPADGHPDHRAAGEALRLVAGDLRRLEYPVWAWHWGGPTDLPRDGVIAVPLSPSARRAKAAAIAAHRSQSEGDDPVLTDRVLAHFRRHVEAFVVDAATKARLRRIDRASAPFFESLYRTTPSADPWDLDRNPADVAKAAAVVDEVGIRPHARVLEVGCGPGVITASVAPRVASVLALDASAAAIEAARRRCAGLEDVELRRAVVPEDLRDDDTGFDVVLLSDVGYYASVDGLIELVEAIRVRCTDESELIAAHWDGWSPDHRLDAATVHDVIDSTLGWRRSRARSLPAHRFDVWSRR